MSTLEMKSRPNKFTRSRTRYLEEGDTGTGEQSTIHRKPVIRHVFHKLKPIWTELNLYPTELLLPDLSPPHHSLLPIPKPSQLPLVVTSPYSQEIKRWIKIRYLNVAECNGMQSITELIPGLTSLEGDTTT